MGEGGSKGYCGELQEDGGEAAHSSVGIAVRYLFSFLRRWIPALVSQFRTLQLLYVVAEL